MLRISRLMLLVCVTFFIYAGTSNAQTQCTSISATPNPIDRKTGPKPLSLAGVNDSTFTLAKFKIATSGVDSTQRDIGATSEVDLQKKWSVTPYWSHGQRTLLVLLPSYDDKWKTKPLSANVTQLYSGTIQHSILFSNGVSGFLVGHAYHNNSQGIRVEQDYGGGISKVVDTKHNGSFELDGDFRYINESLYPHAPNSNLVGANIALRYDRQVISKVIFLTSLGYTPIFNQSSKWRASGTADITYALTQAFSLVVGAFDNYYESAPVTFNKNYLKATVGIQYSPVKGH